MRRHYLKSGARCVHVLSCVLVGCIGFQILPYHRVTCPQSQPVCISFAFLFIIGAPVAVDTVLQIFFNVIIEHEDNMLTSMVGLLSNILRTLSLESITGANGIGARPRNKGPTL